MPEIVRLIFLTPTRRLALTRQRLARPRPTSLMEVARRLPTDVET